MRTFHRQSQSWFTLCTAAFARVHKHYSHAPQTDDSTTSCASSHGSVPPRRNTRSTDTLLPVQVRMSVATPGAPQRSAWMPPGVPGNTTRVRIGAVRCPKCMGNITFLKAYRGLSKSQHGAACISRPLRIAMHESRSTTFRVNPARTVWGRRQKRSAYDFVSLSTHAYPWDSAWVPATIPIDGPREETLRMLCQISIRTSNT
jgi:hypothetical protein